MKQIYFILAAATAMLLAASCNKEQNAPEEPQVEEKGLVTIKATVPEKVTKVSAEYSGTVGVDSKLTLKWEAGDIIFINGNGFSIDDASISVDGKTATFTGTDPGAGPYNIIYDGISGSIVSQTQDSDKNADHIQYSVTLSGVDSYEDISFTEAWATAHSGTISQSSALHLQAILPTGVAATVTSVVISADKAIFDGTKSLTVTLDNVGDTDSDNVLDIFAKLPVGTTAIDSGTTLLVSFNTNNAAHSVYTRYYKTSSALAFTAGRLNTIKLTCTNTDKYAGKDDDGTAEHPYLIADPYQVVSINSLAAKGETTFFKMVANVDMTGVTHTPINDDKNTDPTYNRSVSFDGNNKTISNLSKSLFYVFKGAITNLTLDGSNTTMRGIFAEYCQGIGHTITNVDIVNGSLTSSSDNCGAMIGRINSGSSGETTVTISNCEVSSTTVTGAGKTGGFIGSAEVKVVVEDCSTSASVTGKGASVGGFVGNSTDASMTRCSSTGNVVKNNANGNYVGGFAGVMETCTLNGCYATGSVTTTAVTSEHVGGFIGNLRPATGALASIQNCYATGSVNGSGRWTGGFIGYIYRTTDNCGNVEISKCYASGNATVTANKNYVAGFIARSYMYTGSHLTIEKCYATGDVSATGSGVSAFLGEIGEATTCTISDCYSTGNVSGANQLRGGLVGIVNGNANTSATISRCYASGTIDGNFRLGGLIGNLNNSNTTVRDCAAWNDAVTATSAVQTNWSSGAVIATAHPNSHVINNFRNPNMTLTVYCPPPTADWDHPDIEGTTHPLYQNSPTAPFTWAESTATAISAGTSNVDAGRWAYHGWHTTETRLSTLASTAKGASSGQGGLGWSSEVWDFSGPLPLLK